MSYQTFRMHCRRAGLGQGAAATAVGSGDRSEPAQAPDAGAARSGSGGTTNAPERGFRHERMPRKRDIYG